MQTVRKSRLLGGKWGKLAGLAVLPLALVSGCQTAEGTGALAGGAGGALIGNGIGKAVGGPGSRTAGTLIGGAVGTIGGALIGRSQDQANARAKQAEADAVAARAQPPLQIPDVVRLTQQGVSDAVIINQIRTTGSVYRLTADDLTYLQQNAVSSAVVTEMQATATRVPQRVYVQQPVYVAPAPPPPVVTGAVIYSR